MSRKIRFARDSNSPEWLSIYKEDILRNKPYIQSNKLDELLAAKLGLRYELKQNNKLKGLRTPAVYNPGAVLNLPARPNRYRSALDNNSPEWMSIYKEDILRNNRYIQSHSLDHLLAQRLQQRYDLRAKRPKSKKKKVRFVSPRVSPRVIPQPNMRVRLTVRGGV